MIDAHLIVATQAAGLDQPAKCPLNDPALGQNLETFSSVTSAHNFQPQLAERAKLLNPLDQGSQVAAIGPDNLDSPIHGHEQWDKILGSVAILDRGGCDHNRQNQSQAIHREVTFAPQHLFACVVATLSCLIARLDRLAVNDGRSRGDLAFLGPAQPVAQRVVNKPSGPILGPLSKVAIDRLPGTEISGQQSPRATRADHIENSVDQIATIQRDRSSTLSFSGFWGRNKRLDLVPFFIGQIGWIISWMRLHPSHL